MCLSTRIFKVFLFKSLDSVNNPDTSCKSHYFKFKNINTLSKLLN